MSKDVLSAVEPAPDGLVERLLDGARWVESASTMKNELVDLLREAAVALMPRALTSRAAVLEEAAKICEQPKMVCCGDFDSIDHGVLGVQTVCCGHYQVEDYMDGIECAAAIRAAKGE